MRIGEILRASESDPRAQLPHARNWVTTEIESAIGKGATFIIRLPLAEEMPAAKKNGEVAVKSNSALNVLVVDDEARSREVLMAYLRTDNHAVATASSGREALEKFRLRPFDLVVMDRAMPEMSNGS